MPVYPLRTPMDLTYHELKTVCLSSVQKLKDHYSRHCFRIFMFSNNVDLKNNNINYRKGFRILCVRE